MELALVTGLLAGILTSLIQTSITLSKIYNLQLSKSDCNCKGGNK